MKSKRKNSIKYKGIVYRKMAKSSQGKAIDQLVEVLEEFAEGPLTSLDFGKAWIKYEKAIQSIKALDGDPHTDTEITSAISYLMGGAVKVAQKGAVNALKELDRLRLRKE